MKNAVALAAGLTLALVACDDRVTRYPLERVDDPVTANGNIWMPRSPTSYQVVASGDVVGEMRGFLTKYEDCVVLDAQNWKCSLDGAPGEHYWFGAREGSFWDSPVPGDLHETKHVSRLEYNLIRCQWAFTEPSSEPLFWRGVKCVWSWE